VPEKLHRMNVADIKKETSPEREAQMRYLAELPDDQIDTSDIPEITEEQWATARRGAHFRPLKTPVTIRLDADVVAWFKQTAESGKYQSEINRVLRRHMVEKQHRPA
jgi:uncharacterized protein (DUF4415 family)